MRQLTLVMKVLLFGILGIIALKFAGVALARNGNNPMLYRALHITIPYGIVIGFALIGLSVLLGSKLSDRGLLRKTSSGFFGQRYEAVMGVPASEVALIAWRVSFAFAFLIVFLVV